MHITSVCEFTLLHISPMSSYTSTFLKLPLLFRSLWHLLANVADPKCSSMQFCYSLVGSYLFPMCYWCFRAVHPTSRHCSTLCDNPPLSSRHWCCTYRLVFLSFSSPAHPSPSPFHPHINPPSSFYVPTILTSFTFFDTPNFVVPLIIAYTYYISAPLWFHKSI